MKSNLAAGLCGIPLKPIFRGHTSNKQLQPGFRRIGTVLATTGS